MPPGVPLTDETKEKIIAMKASGMTGASIARQLNVSEATVSKTVKNYKTESPDQFEELRTENRKKIVDTVWDSVYGLSSLLQRRVNLLLEHEDKLSQIVSVIGGSEEISDSTKKSLIKSMAELMSPKLVEITTALGTAWDKLERSQAEIDTAETSGVVILSEVKPLEPPQEGDEDGEITTG